VTPITGKTGSGHSQAFIQRVAGSPHPFHYVARTRSTLLLLLRSDGDKYGLVVDKRILHPARNKPDIGYRLLPDTPPIFEDTPSCGTCTQSRSFPDPLDRSMGILQIFLASNKQCHTLNKKKVFLIG
jgi:hypothetical protein